MNGSTVPGCTPTRLGMRCSNTFFFGLALALTLNGFELEAEPEVDEEEEARN